MAITKLSNSGIATGGVLKYDSMLAGNPAFSPTSYQSIASYEVGAGGISSITFSGIPATYKHLQIRTAARSSAGIAGDYIQFNGDTATNYTRHELAADGSTVGVAGNTSQTYINTNSFSSASNFFNVGIIDILEYANTNIFKTVRCYTGFINTGTSLIYIRTGAWRSTSAINSITLTMSSGNYQQYTSVALYGIVGA